MTKMRRRRANKVRLIKTSGVMFVFIPAFLDVCKVLGLLDFSVAHTIGLAAIGSAFSLLFIFGAEKWLSDRNDKDGITVIDDVYWAFNVIFFTYIAYNANEKILAIGIFLVMPFVVSMLPVEGKKTSLSSGASDLYFCLFLAYITHIPQNNMHTRRKYSYLPSLCSITGAECTSRRLPMKAG